MRVYNYSDKPVVINGVPIHEHLVFIDSGMPKSHVSHNGYKFLPIWGDEPEHDRNVIFTITNASSGYHYREDVYNNPPVWWFSSILIVSIGYLMLIKVMQKIRARI